MNQNQQFATIVLELTGQARVGADDQTLRAVLAARAWLKAIADRQFDVVPVLADKSDVADVPQAA